MKRALAIADRAALLSLKLLAAANILFLISFLVVTALAVGKARAELPACTGQDMMAEMQRSRILPPSPRSAPRRTKR